MNAWRTAVLVIFLAVVAGPAVAQDLEVFELDTFLDPSTLTVEDDHGNPLHLTYLAAYLRSGVSQHFQYRSEYVHSEVGFVDLVGTLVRRRLQLVGRWTGYDFNGSGLRAGRAEAQIGYYFASPSPGGSTPGVDLSRLQLSLAHSTASTPTEGTTLSVDWDFSPTPYDVIGGLSYSYFRPDQGCGRGCSQALSFDIRTRIWKPSERLGFDLGIGGGMVQRQGATRADTLRTEFRLKWRTPKDRATIYGVYAPAYRLGGGVGGSRTNHEVTLFMHLRLWSLLLPRPREGAE
jgi:hypothetical protein